MRQFSILLLALLFGACGGSIDKDSSNSSPNNANNASQNNTSNATSNNTGPSNNIVVFNNANNAEPCPMGQQYDPVRGECVDIPANNGQPTACDSRAECTSAQECVDSVCTDHWTCDSDGGPNGSGCSNNWYCDDDKVYSLSCDTLEEDFSMVSCVCLVNDVGVAEFVDDGEASCGYDTTHRAANEHCGWLVPAF